MSSAPLNTVRFLAERPSSAAIAASALLLWRETLRLPRPGPGGPTTSNSESPQPEPELLFSSEETPLERSASASASPPSAAPDSSLHVLGVRRFRVTETLAFDGVRRQPAPEEEERFCEEELRDGCSEMGCESGWKNEAMLEERLEASASEESSLGLCSWRRCTFTLGVTWASRSRCATISVARRSTRVRVCRVPIDAVGGQTVYRIKSFGRARRSILEFEAQHINRRLGSFGLRSEVSGIEQCDFEFLLSVASDCSAPYAQITC